MPRSTGGETMATTPTPEVAPKPPKTDGEKPAKVKKEKAPKPEKPVKPPKVKAEKPPKVKKEKAPRAPKAPRVKKPLNKKLVLIIAIVVMLILLAGVGIFIAKMLSGKSSDKKAESSSSDIVSSESSEGADNAESTSDGDDPAKSDPETVFQPESSGEEGRDAVEGDQPDASTPADGSSSSSTEIVGGVGGVSSAPEETKPFVFDERSLTLPAYSYRTSNALERAVHNDLQAMLDSKDDRPGVGIAAVVIADSYVMENGTLRVLAYVWSNRYAIAENTLFDYGSMAGPVALDYAGAGVYALDQIHLPRADDAYEQSVKDLCGAKEETAKRMIRKGYDLELRGQMIRNVSSYITQNNVDVEYFRAGSQTYHKNGEIYIPKNKSAASSQSQKTPTASLTQPPEASAAGASDASATTSSAAEPSETPTTQDAQPTDEKQLEEDYKNVQKLPL